MHIKEILATSTTSLKSYQTKAVIFIRSFVKILLYAKFLKSAD